VATISTPASDAAAGTPSLRSLGTGANQAAPGNDNRFPKSPSSNANPPTTGSLLVTVGGEVYQIATINDSD
jgi:hypothetical protein